MQLTKNYGFTTLHVENKEIRAFRFYSKEKGIILSIPNGYLQYRDTNKEVTVPELKRRIRKDNMLNKGGCFYAKHVNYGKKEDWMNSYDNQDKVDVFFDIDDPDIDFNI